MKQHVALFAVGSSLLVPASAEAGAQVTWKDATSGTRVSSHTSGTCAEFPKGGPLDLTCVDNVKLDPKFIGPGGGVILGTYDDLFIEGDLRTGRVQAVTVDAGGKVVSTRELLRDVTRLRRNAPFRDRLRTLITTSIEGAPTSSAIVVGGGDVHRPVLSFNVVTYLADAKGNQVLDESDLAFDLDTLEPTISPRAMLSYTRGKEEVREVQYWISYWTQ